MIKLWAFVSVLVVFSSGGLALPITPPDLRNCKPVQARDDLVVDCCLPYNVPLKEFKFPDPSEPLRIRKNAASLDAESIRKYNLALERMRALPPDDPRSFTVQSNMHCGYCCEVFPMLNSTKILQIHRNWLLLPFHRMYVYFHERILGSLIDDPTFAIPYWNWDNQSSTHHPYPNAIPEFFYSEPGLFDIYRDPDHAPPNIIDLHYGPFFGMEVPEGSTEDEIRELNKNFLHQSLVSGSALPDLFLGGIYKFDGEVPWTPSIFEVGPHASVHGWVGSAYMPKGEDLAPAYSAARDPVFFSHHSNVDRLYRDWHDLGGRRGYPMQPDWLDASFYFYDEMGDMVRVSVAQFLDMDKLRYTFEPTENCWVEDPSIPLSTPDSSKPGSRYWIAKTVSSIFSWMGVTSIPVEEFLGDIPDIDSVRNPKFSSSAFRSRVARPHAALRAAGKLDHLEEVLVIDKIWIPSKEPVWFDIFINLPEANEKTPLNATEWSGRFNNGPHLDQAGHIERESVFSISIGEKLRKLGIVDQPSVVVSLVPRGPLKHQREIQIKTIRIDIR